MRYKAIMLDVDGTLSPYSSTSLPELPTPPVIAAIKGAIPHVHIGLATSRPLRKVRPILDVLALDGFTILQNGAQIIESKTQRTVWRKAVPTDTLGILYELAREFEITTYYADFENDIRLETMDQLLAGPISSVFYDGIDEENYPQMVTRLGAIEGVTVHKLSSKWANKREIGVTSIEASKEKAINHLASLLEISTAEIIGVGDAHNDISLLSACGLKIAMGNAVPEVKQIADVIAPTVDEDGVAWIINTYVNGK